MTAKAIAKFSSPERLATWTKVLLLANLVFSLIAIGSGILEVDLLSRAVSSDILDSEVSLNDLREQVIAILQFFVYASTAVAFLMWFSRVHKNLPSLGARELKYSSGWAVGGFFVPFLNLVRPLQVMREIWHGSDPAGVSRESAADGRPITNQLGTPALVVIWWVLFLISGLLDRIALRESLGPGQTIEQLQALDYLVVCCDVVDMGTALVAFFLVSRITGWQAHRYSVVVRTSDDLMLVGSPPGAALISLPSG